MRYNNKKKRVRERVAIARGKKRKTGRGALSRGYPEAQNSRIQVSGQTDDETREGKRVRGKERESERERERERERESERERELLRCQFVCVLIMGTLPTQPALDDCLAELPLR